MFKLIKIDSEDIYNITEKRTLSNKCCSSVLFLFIIKFPQKKKKSSTTVFNINKK